MCHVTRGQPMAVLAALVTSRQYDMKNSWTGSQQITFDINNSRLALVSGCTFPSVYL